MRANRSSFATPSFRSLNTAVSLLIPCSEFDTPIKLPILSWVARLRRVLPVFDTYRPTSGHRISRLSVLPLETSYVTLGDNWPDPCAYGVGTPNGYTSQRRQPEETDPAHPYRSRAYC